MKKTTKISFNTSNSESIVKVKEGVITSVWANDTGQMGGAGYLFRSVWFGPDMERRMQLKLVLAALYRRHEYAEDKLAPYVKELNYTI